MPFLRYLCASCDDFPIFNLKLVLVDLVHHGPIPSVWFLILLAQKSVRKYGGQANVCSSLFYDKVTLQTMQCASSVVDALLASYQNEPKLLHMVTLGFYN